MTDWLSSMQQTFEYYVVDPDTWKDVKLIDTVKKCTISRDDSSKTLGSATIDVTESLGECYVRVYLVTIQNGEKNKYPLGTFLVQTPSSSFNGKSKSHSIDAYTPLLELDENPPPLGYSILKESNIIEKAYLLTQENLRAPVVKTACSETLFNDFVADPSDTWLTFLNDLLSNAKYKFDLDELGRILFSPIQDAASLQPVWSFNDDNSSILYPDVDVEHDIYKIPNVVEVIYSNGGSSYYAKAVNDDPNSPTSTVNRKREILYRVTNPDLIGNPTNDQIQRYATQLLRNLSSLEYTVSYSHGYCPVRVGDCVLLNYKRAGLDNIKAKIVSQKINCEPGCQVTEKAIFTRRLWGD